MSGHEMGLTVLFRSGRITAARATGSISLQWGGEYRFSGGHGEALLQGQQVLVVDAAFPREVARCQVDLGMETMVYGLEGVVRSEVPLQGLRTVEHWFAHRGALADGALARLG